MALLDEDVFVVFDPHPRMDHPNGPGFMLSTSRVTTASFLNCMLDTPAPYDVTTRGGDILLPLHSQYFTAHLLSPKENYHRITAYQNEQMLRDSFLCAHEESLSTSVAYVNLWNQLLPDAAGPSCSSGAAARSHHHHPISSSSSSSNSSSSSAGSPQTLLNALPSTATTRFNDPWVPDTAFRQYLLEHMNSTAHHNHHHYHHHKTSAMDLKKAIKTTFDCAVCLDTYPVYSSVQLSGCDHPFCKECLQGHVQSFFV